MQYHWTSSVEIKYNLYYQTLTFLIELQNILDKIRVLEKLLLLRRSSSWARDTCAAHEVGSLSRSLLEFLLPKQKLNHIRDQSASALMGARCAKISL